MSSQDNVHNKHEKTDNNGQRNNRTHGGELRNGRLSQIKNNNPYGDEIQNEFVSRKED